MIDIIKMIDDAYCQARYGAGVLLEWPYESNVLGADVEKMLRSYGVRVYARQYARQDGDNYGLHVRRQQAKWARHLLTRYLAGGQLPRHQVQRDGKARPGVKAVGLAGRILDWLG